MLEAIAPPLKDRVRSSTAVSTKAAAIHGAQVFVGDGRCLYWFVLWSTCTLCPEPPDHSLQRRRRALDAGVRSTSLDYTYFRSTALFRIGISAP